MGTGISLSVIGSTCAPVHGATGLVEAIAAVGIPIFEGRIASALPATNPDKVAGGAGSPGIRRSASSLVKIIRRTARSDRMNAKISK